MDIDLFRKLNYLPKRELIYKATSHEAETILQLNCHQNTINNLQHSINIYSKTIDPEGIKRRKECEKLLKDIENEKKHLENLKSNL